MHRQHINPGQRIIHNLNKPVLERVKSRKVVGPYIVTPSDSTHDVFFYLDSDFSPLNRWQWADEIVRLNHNGWYTDEFCDSDVIRGIVFRLPHGRGFLAGWSMGDSMATIAERYIYSEETSAAFTADSIAQYAAEKEREYQLANNE